MAIPVDGPARAQVERALIPDEATPLAEAVTRSLGVESWVLTFDGRDRLRAVAIFGKPTVAAPSTPSVPDPAGDPLERSFPLPDGGVLSRWIGGPAVTGHQLLDVALHSGDADVRVEAVRVAVDALMREPALEQRLLAAIGVVDDAALAAAVVGFAGDGAAGLVSLVADRARGRPLGRRAAGVLERLAPR